MGKLASCIALGLCPSFCNVTARLNRDGKFSLAPRTHCAGPRARGRTTLAFLLKHLSNLFRLVGDYIVTNGMYRNQGGRCVNMHSAY